MGGTVHVRQEYRSVSLLQCLIKVWALAWQVCWLAVVPNLGYGQAQPWIGCKYVGTCWRTVICFSVAFSCTLKQLPKIKIQVCRFQSQKGHSDFFFLCLVLLFLALCLREDWVFLHKLLSLYSALSVVWFQTFLDGSKAIAISLEEEVGVLM